MDYYGHGVVHVVQYRHGHGQRDRDRHGHGYQNADGHFCPYADRQSNTNGRAEVRDADSSRQVDDLDTRSGIA